MKRILTLLFSVVLMMVMVGCSSKLSTYQEVSLDDLYQKLEKKDSFILTIGSADCSHCASFQPKMETVIKIHQVTVFYIDTSKLDKTEYRKLIQKLNFTGTPTTMFFKDGKETSMSDRIEGDKDIETIERKMKKNGYIE